MYSIFDFSVHVVHVSSEIYVHVFTKYAPSSSVCSMQLICLSQHMHASNAMGNLLQFYVHL
jgi:hypothetical protein